jgi:hypothetical protein
MSRIRDLIQEIVEIRQRQVSGSAMGELWQRFLTLEHAFEKHDKSEEETIRYFPVALVACIEGYCRMAIKELIDAGEPYLANAEKLLSSSKSDFSVLRAVYGKKITVGEFVAHSVRLSSLEHLETAFSSLIGTGFLQALRAATDRWAHEVEGKPTAPILPKPDEVFASVARTFELRHIICHEIASAYAIESEEVARCFMDCEAFLRAANEFITETLYPGVPLTQTEMNAAAWQSLEERRELLRDSVAKLRSRLDTAECTVFDDAQEKWQAYCDAWATFVAEEFDGGSIWPVIYAGAAEALVRQRIEEVGAYKRI